MPPSTEEVVQTKPTRVLPENGIWRDNEIRFQSKAGEEKVTINAKLDLDTNVKQDATHLVGQDLETIVGRHEKRSVKENRTVEVARDDTLTVYRDLNTTVDRHEIHVVKENRSVQVEGNDTLIIVQGDHQVTLREGSASLNVAKTRKVTAAKVWIEATGDDLSLKCGKGKIHMSRDGNITIIGETIRIVGKQKVRINCTPDEQLWNPAMDDPPPRPSP
jgi:type VI secretion system secreted protein VgrG